MKAELCRKIAKLLANGNAAEERRLYAYHMTRDLAGIRETYARQLAIEATTEAEIRTHCQFAGLPKVGR